MGVTEPQLRKSLHLHALMGLLGCRDLEELLLRADLARTFVQIWQYVASVCFRSPEAFAAHCGSEEAMTALASEPLIPLKEAQKEVLSGDYARACITSQLEARGLSSDAKPPSTAGERPFESLAPRWLQDKHLSADGWSSKAVVHFNTAYRTCGNHSCLPRVCYKGKHGRKGLCHMLYWHWRTRLPKKDASKRVLKRVKGRKLQARWTPAPPDCPATLPPLEENPPQRGMPAVETNHGFTCKFHPCGALGPCCNHDLGVLLRLPVLSEALTAKLGETLFRPSVADAASDGIAPTRVDLSADELAEFTTACREMYASVIDHEYYCGSYASKEQPKLKELLKSMSTSLHRLQDKVSEAKERGEAFTNMDEAAKMLHSLVCAVNRCSHKGYPELVSYLTKQPTFYGSHAFTNLYMFDQQNLAQVQVAAFIAKKTGQASDQKPGQLLWSSKLSAQHQLNDLDYMWRPEILSNVPWYFFAAMTHADKELKWAFPWYATQNNNWNWVTHPHGAVMHSKSPCLIIVASSQAKLGCP